jgi:phosphohistidine phosphatase SixA/plastocyanin
MQTHPSPTTHPENPSMSLRQLTRAGPIMQQRKIRFVLYAMFVTGIAACTKNSGAQAGANSDPYSSSSAAAPTTQRQGASSVNVLLSEWKLELSQLTVPTGEVEFTVTNRGTMQHAFEVEGQGLEKDIEPLNVGATSTLRLTLPPGTYSVYCPIDNGAHKKMGMIGHIDVLGSVDLGRLVTGMKNGGYVIVFRHGATNPNQADTDPLHRDNIGAQRLLSAQGREVAVRVGDSFRMLGIPLGKVYSSEFNRATETAKLVSGKSVTTTPDLTEGGLVVSPAENARRAKALKGMASTAPETGVNTLIVTHKPNILDAFGEDWFDSKEGEASVFKPDGSNGLVLVARVQATDWIKAVARQ